MLAEGHGRFDHGPRLRFKFADEPYETVNTRFLAAPDDGQVAAFQRALYYAPHRCRKLRTRCIYPLTLSKNFGSSR